MLSPSAVEVLLPDGDRVMVSFVDPAARARADDLVIESILQAEETAAGVELAVADALATLGFDCRVEPVHEGRNIIAR